MSDEENQIDEICVLESIYTEEELFFDKNEKSVKSGHFIAYINVPEEFHITYKNFKDDVTVTVPLLHLPPITLKFKLPQDYPSKRMPDYEISCMWLAVRKLNQLCKRLDELWVENKGSVILYIWTQFLKEESLEYLGIGKSLDLTRRYLSEVRRFSRNIYRPTSESVDSGINKDNCNSATEQSFSIEASNCDVVKDDEVCMSGSKEITSQSPTVTRRLNSCSKAPYARYQNERNATLVKDPRIEFPPAMGMHTHDYLTVYSEDRANIHFQRNVYLCEICFQDKIGYKSVQFKPCKHVYCKECIKEYFEVRINDGMVQTMPCPHEACKSEATQNQIKEVVGEVMFDKYDKLLLNATLNMMDDITYCPRQSCGTPVMRDTDDKMAVCSSCRYVFCVFCKMTFHGVEPCRLKAEEKRKLVEEYEGGNTEAKFRLEKRYGKKQLQAMVQVHKSESWISTNSKPCPHCNANIEKSDGCNKMACWKCKQYFCWLCLKILDINAPYQHYMDPSSRCLNQLFYGVNMEEMLQDQEFEDEDFIEIYEMEDDEDNEEYDLLDHDLLQRYFIV